MLCVVGGLAAALLAMPAEARDIVIDGAHSYARFHLDLPMGRELDGRFPRMQAEWLPQADGRWRVSVWLPADAAEIRGRPRYTRIMRGEMFFDSQRHPNIQFLSDPFETGMLTRGGALSGVLTMRGVAQRESLRLAPSTCRPPVLRNCVIEVQGEVRRRDYGITPLKGVLGDIVEFRLRITHGAES